MKRAVLLIVAIAFSLQAIALCRADNVTLAWEASPDNITGYLLCASDDFFSGEFAQCVTLGTVTEYSGDMPDGVWCFVIKGIAKWYRDDWSQPVCVAINQPCGGCGAPLCPSTTTTTICGGCGLPPCA